MPLDLEALRKEVEAYLEEDGVPVFHGYHRMIDAINQVTWDAEKHPDFRGFIAAGKKAGANLFTYSSLSFSLDQIDDAMDMLEDTMLPHDEKRNFETKLRQLQAYEGFTCAIDLSFTLNGLTYNYSRESEWYRSLNDILAELDALAEVSDTEEEENSGGLGGYFSRTERVGARPVAHWKERKSETGLADRLREQLGVSRVIAEILAGRGYTDAQQAREFLFPELEKLHDPFLLRGMEAAATRIQTAIGAREPVLIYGDYDVDGTTSVVVLKKTIELLGGTADFHIPHRLRDGYGMRTDVVEQAAQSGVRLIISVDTGIRAGAVVERANQLGIDVIVTDHHLPEAELPPALAVLNPNRADCDYPCKHLCGAGVTLKLVHALLLGSTFDTRKQQSLLDSFLKPVAIATVADIVPLTGENRIIVRRGLSGLSTVRNPGLRALLTVAGLEEGEAPSAHQVAFRLAPRINAAGRMATASDVIELFLTPDSARAQAIAEQLDVLNRERQEVERAIVEQIVKQCEEDEAHLEGAALVFANAEWHLGVLGIVASRLVERFYRPVFVLGAGVDAPDGSACFTGSGRSIPSFHLLEALESMGHLFTRFGGHRGAAGLTLLCQSLDDFRKGFSDYAASTLTEDARRPEFTADATVTLEELNDRTVREILDLGPFGFGNTAPLLLVRDLTVSGEARALGSERHLSAYVKQNGTGATVKAWNFGDRAELFGPGKRIDLLLQVEDDPASRKRGYRGWSLTVKDARPAED